VKKFNLVTIKVPQSSKMQRELIQDEYFGSLVLSPHLSSIVSSPYLSSALLSRLLGCLFSYSISSFMLNHVSSCLAVYFLLLTPRFNNYYIAPVLHTMPLF
jgi:hypothetical protein